MTALKRTGTNAQGDPSGRYTITCDALTAWLEALPDA